MPLLSISYLGHSCFLVETENKTKILMDPYDKSVGYSMEPVYADIVTISHEHYDHNYHRLALGNPKILKGTDGGRWVGIDTTINNIRIYTISVYHDEENGMRRGKNSIFVFETHYSGLSVRFAHLGDLGHDLKPEDVTRMGKIDVLFIPVGGYFTIGPKEADSIIFKTSPKIIIPMHHKTSATSTWPLEPVDTFIQNKTEVIHVNNFIAYLNESDLMSKNIIWVLDYRK